MKHSKLTLTAAVLVAFVALFGLMSLSLGQQHKIAYVDTNVLLESYQGMKEAKQAYQLKASKWQSNIDTLKAELEAKIKDFEATKSKMSQKEQKLSKEVITSKRDQLVQYNQAIGQQAQQEDQKLTDGVLVQVNAYLKEYGKEEGYDMIFGANGSGTVIYGKDAINITENVLKGLNDVYTGK